MALARKDAGLGSAPVTVADLAATIAKIATEYPSDANVQLAEQQVAALQTGSPGPGLWVTGGAAAVMAGGAAALGGVAGFALRGAMRRSKQTKLAKGQQR